MVEKKISLSVLVLLRGDGEIIDRLSLVTGVCVCVLHKKIRIMKTKGITSFPDPFGL
jgi:hypothetical protein